MGNHHLSRTLALGIGAIVGSLACSGCGSANSNSTQPGGSAATGGASDTGNTAGGTSAIGGSNAAGDATGGAPAPSGSCGIAVKDAFYSSAIGTVGIVTWSTTLADVSEASIEFGVDTNYGLTAPVDLTQTDYRTLLLGMKQGHAAYHFRIRAKSGTTECVGPDNVFSAGTATKPNTLKPPTVTTNNKSALFGGFLVMEGYRLAYGAGDYAFILDTDGDVVWWYQPHNYGSLSVAKMTYDGKSIWIANDNVPQKTTHVGRLSMDGLTFEDKSTEFQDFNHDLTVLPDETVIFIAYGSNDCDDVRQRDPDGTVHTITNAGKAFGTSGGCHCNAIQYDPSDDTVIVSEDNHSGYFKTDRKGVIKWVLNGGTSNQFDKSGGGATGWIGNHNLHIIGKDHILFFNNGVSAYQSGTKPATARELLLNTATMTTSEVWSYQSSPTISNGVMGDVQRLDNGNTIIAYSTAGTIHEVDAKKNVLQTLVWSGLSSAGFGYVTKRKTLYGKPPR